MLKLHKQILPFLLASPDLCRKSITASTNTRLLLLSSLCMWYKNLVTWLPTFWPLRPADGNLRRNMFALFLLLAGHRNPCQVWRTIYATIQQKLVCLQRGALTHKLPRWNGEIMLYALLVRFCRWIELLTCGIKKV